MDVCSTHDIDVNGKIFFMHPYHVTAFAIYQYFYQTVLSSYVQIETYCTSNKIALLIVHILPTNDVFTK